MSQNAYGINDSFLGGTVTGSCSQTQHRHCYLLLFYADAAGAEAFTMRATTGGGGELPTGGEAPLNGDPFELEGPVTVEGLLAHLDIDPRTVAVERNLVVVKKAAFGDTPVDDGDQIEIVNFVGGG